MTRMRSPSMRPYGKRRHRGTEFVDLAVGDRFAWIEDSQRYQKTAPNAYQDTEGNEHSVTYARSKAQVFNVEGG